MDFSYYIICILFQAALIDAGSIFFDIFALIFLFDKLCKSQIKNFYWCIEELKWVKNSINFINVNSSIVVLFWNLTFNSTSIHTFNT